MPKFATSAFSSTRRIAAVLLALACLPYIFWSGSNMMAGIYDFKARAFIEAWEHQNLQASLQNAEFIPGAADLATAQNHARRAVQLSPRHAGFHQTLGDTLYWNYKGLIQNPGRSSQNIEMLDAYRSAIKLRPTFPDYYLRLARAKIMTGVYDQELILALQNSRRFGPWKPNNMYDTVELGLWSWPHLAPPARQVIIDVIEQSQRWQLDERMNIRNSVAIWNLVVAYNRKTDICPMLSRNNARNAQFCRFSIEKPSSTPGHT